MRGRPFQVPRARPIEPRERAAVLRSPRAHVRSNQRAPVPARVALGGAGGHPRSEGPRRRRGHGPHDGPPRRRRRDRPLPGDAPAGPVPWSPGGGGRPPVAIPSGDVRHGRPRGIVLLSPGPRGGLSGRRRPPPPGRDRRRPVRRDAAPRAPRADPLAGGVRGPHGGRRPEARAVRKEGLGRRPRRGTEGLVHLLRVGRAGPPRLADPALLRIEDGHRLDHPAVLPAGRLPSPLPAGPRPPAPPPSPTPPPPGGGRPGAVL